MVQSIDVSPRPAALIMSMRSLGYDLNMAIADIIDNSISANAKNIRVGFIWKEKDSIIFIKDDGHGMDDSELIEAMRLGTIGPEVTRQNTDLGRFGMGLKTASFSQCTRLSVTTRKANSVEANKLWDLDLVKKTNKWLLLSPLLNEFEDYVGQLSESGTIVVWSNLDKSIFKEFDNITNPSNVFLELAEKTANHIRTTFCDFGLGNDPINFYVNDRKIEMWDPFLTKHEKTQMFTPEVFKIDNSKITVTPYVLPHHSHLTSDEISTASGERGWLDQQGFYIFRNKRLIVSGNWLDSRIEKKLSTKNARIKIDIDSDCDDLWNIDLKKSRAVPPESLRKNLKRIAEYTREASERLYKHRGKIITRNQTEKDAFVWLKMVKNGKLSYVLNRKNPIIKEIIQINDEKSIESLLQVIESTLPVMELLATLQNDDTSVSDDQFKISEETLLSIANELYSDYIKQGMQSEKILLLLQRIQPFSLHPEIFDKMGYRNE